MWMAVAFALALAVAGTTAHAAQWMRGERGAEIQIFIDNDKWAGSDRYYTNGFKVGFGVDATNMPGLDLSGVPMTALGRALGCTPFSEAATNGGVFVGQNMYTPRDISIAGAQRDDRPWAAWLYLGLVFQARRTCGDRSAALDTIELDVGVVGPAAQGEEIQNWWHGLVNVKEAQGWANQIPNEPAFLLTYLHKQLWKHNENVHFIPHVGAAVGTVMTFVRAGGLVRVGRNMTGFGPDRIEPGAAILQNFRTGSDPCAAWTFCEGYVFAGAEGRAVAYNIFLDGTVFRDSPDVKRTPLVYDLSVGFSFRFWRARVSATRITRSQEFTTPVRGGGKQTFHSFNIGFEF